MQSFCTRSKLVLVPMLMALLGAVALLFSCQDAKPVDFAGSWSWVNGDSSFNIELRQSGTQLSGWHTSLVNGASRIDSSMPDFNSTPDAPVSIKGQVEGRSATLEIESWYSEGVVYQVTLEMLDGDGALHWKVTKFADGEAYIPDDIQMERLGAGNVRAVDPQTPAGETGDAGMEEWSLYRDQIDAAVSEIDAATLDQSPRVITLEAQPGSAELWVYEVDATRRKYHTVVVDSNNGEVTEASWWFDTYGTPVKYQDTISVPAEDAPGGLLARQTRILYNYMGDAWTWGSGSDANGDPLATGETPAELEALRADIEARLEEYQGLATGAN